ncbi:hypothetical protein Kpho02_07890 [Kitasatospora phosalacinea]|uniref:Excalibur calcium-binding domain-containing protein n=1 Tax=Kitasatospora phosalacinea TaxID=2065 RepID=A0A9W6Q1W3_9ACTN|nr:excalibur calcium-binding domain-containing protein [Kitasatospora phosalacinea]GLW68490.1 hypothetical protein Kpho02_07890 [Kitasatospora phosalacinea]
MHPHETSPEPEKRSVGHLWGRIALLVLLPPVALVLVWRSHRLRRTEQVLLTVLCGLWTVLLLALVINSFAGKDAPAPTGNDPSPPPGSSSGPSSPSPPPSPSPPTSPTPPSNPTSSPTTGAPTAVVSPPAVVTPTTETAAPESAASSASARPYYGNCAEAKAAGAAPLHAGQPGYRPGLDRDGDGVACEK